MQNNTFNRINPIYKEEDGDTPSMISIVSSRICARIRIEDIEYLEQDYRQLHVVTSDSDYVIYDNLNSIADVFKNNEDFFKPMKTLMLNLGKISKMEDGYIYFEGGGAITMGRNAYSKTRTEFIRRLQKYKIQPSHMYAVKVAEKP